MREVPRRRFAHIKKPTADTIINPKKLAYERNLESCGMCHSRGVSKPDGSLGYPWNDKDNKPYIVGEPLDAYYQFRPGEWGGLQAHSKSHHQQWHDLLRSKHYAAKVTCVSCHDPHGSANPFQTIKQDRNNDLCLTCHGKRFPNPDAGPKAHPTPLRARNDRDQPLFFLPHGENRVVRRGG